MSRATSTTIRATTVTSTRTTTPKRSERSRGGVVLAAAVAWSLFAFGGAYTWTLIPLAIGAVALVIVSRPSIGQSRTRTLDAALLCCLLVVACQLVPLPTSVRLLLSPARATVDRELFLGAAADRASAPLTVDPAATIGALIAAATALAVFWSARAIFERGSMRRVVRAIAICGLVASAVAVLQHATAPKLIYWIWRPLNADATPYGPFVSRNDLAAWLVMAIPLTLGYLAGRLASIGRRWASLPIEAAVDDRTIWLGASLCAMTVALVVSLSRSGLTAATAALLAFVWMTRGRMASRGRAWLLVGVGVAIAVAAAYVNTTAMITRINETIESGVGSRREIWSYTAAIIRDFWRTGVGVGAYARAMSVYQPPHQFAFNHAHDEYLQVVAEGGVPLALATLVAAGAGALVLVRRLRADRSPMFWVRAGATSGMVAIAVQNIWETGLRMPANAILFAVCAAIALHRPGDADERSA